MCPEASLRLRHHPAFAWRLWPRAIVSRQKASRLGFSAIWNWATLQQQLDVTRRKHRPGRRVYHDVRLERVAVEYHLVVDQDARRAVKYALRVSLYDGALLIVGEVSAVLLQVAWPGEYDSGWPRHAYFSVSRDNANITLLRPYDVTTR